VTSGLSKLPVVVLLILGIQTVFYSFFLSMLGGQRL
jgi:hypothetical protein